ncbi:hypothetical protein QLS91_06410, partial [Flavobacterium sp. LB2P84]|uniref:hypothetical protein n=1 Tax=Flavobacterium yafengii TaxID=3041253 RepID=UPI0024A90B1F
NQLLGTTDLPTYLAWFVLAFIGAVLAILIREITPLKSYNITLLHMIRGFLITFIFIRFSSELLSLEPTSFGAFMIGFGSNELVLLLFKKKLISEPK